MTAGKPFLRRVSEPPYEGGPEEAEVDDDQLEITDDEEEEDGFHDIDHFERVIVPVSPDILLHIIGCRYNGTLEKMTKYFQNMIGEYELERIINFLALKN